MIYENESYKGRKTLLEARAHMRHAMELLGRDGSTTHFLKLISQRNAALWRWKHTGREADNNRGDDECIKKKTNSTQKKTQVMVVADKKGRPCLELEFPPFPDTEAEPGNKFLNPFAFKLEAKERRFYEINTKPVYQNGEYATFRFDGKWFVTCRNNIIVTETTGIPRTLIDALVKGECPSDHSRFHYDRMLETYEYGLRCAKSVGFVVTND